MKSSIKQLILVILLVFSIVSFISNFYVFLNLRDQQKVIKDFGNNVPKLSLNQALKFDLSYPNINAYTVPFKTYIGRVYLRDSMYKKAIATFHEAKKYNPYLLINENYLAEIYDILKVKDSFKYYSKITFDKMPNNPVHFGRYIKAIGPHSDTRLIDSLFLKQKYKSNIFWQLYLSSIVSIENKSDLTKKIFLEAKRLYPFDENIEKLIDYNIFGKENMDKSWELVSFADELVKADKLDVALVVLDDAVKLYENNFILEKIASIHYKLKEYELSIETLKQINKEKIYSKGRYNLIMGISYCELGRNEEGCDFLTNSIFENDPQGIKAKNIYCQ